MGAVSSLRIEILCDLTPVTSKLGGPQFKKKKKMVKISPALTCLPGLAGGWLYVKELEMWFQQGNFVAILRKNGSVTSPRNMRGSIKTTLGIKARFLDGAYCLV